MLQNSLKEKYLTEYPQIKNKIGVLPDGADPTDFDLYKKLDVKRYNKLNVGYTGHLYKGKGMELIAEIVKQCPFAHFHIVGGKEKDIIYWKQKLSKFKNIAFHGYQEHSKIPNYLECFDVVILPNQREVRSNADKNIGQWTSPLKLFEYMAAGKPIIASDLPVLKEILTHKRNSILCPPDDVNCWKKNLLELRDNKELRTYNF